jgi:hypothetical protein
MQADRIESISSYCDGWCDRCRFTSRCSAYAVQVALGMCGDFGEAVELAVGVPGDVQAAPAAYASGVTADGELVEPATQVLRETLEKEAARVAQIRATPIMRQATQVTIQAYQWLEPKAEALAAGPDALLVEALAIVRWDSGFVAAKLARALRGRDRCEHDGQIEDEDAIQNDWNGSAKVALISLERSEAAWQTIADATRDADAAALGRAIGDLRTAVERAFPDAHRFVRPGFDEPHR